MPRPKRAPKAQKAACASTATSTRIRRSGRVAVQNIPDSDEDNAESPLSLLSANSHQTLKAVVIPADTASSSHDRLPPPPTTTKTSVSVTSESSKEDSENYDTPATSAANTPPLTHKRSSILGKRARSGLSKVNNALESDTALAVALQKEEYGENSDSANNRDLDDHDDLSELDQGDITAPLRLDRNLRRSASDESSLGDSTTEWSAPDSMSDSESSQFESDSEDDRPLKKARAPSNRTSFRAPVKRSAHKKSSAKARHNIEKTNDDSSELSDLPEVIPLPKNIVLPAPNPLLDVPRRPRSRKSYAAAVREIEQRTGLQGFRALKERYRLEWAHPEIITMWKELESIPRIPTEQAPQPEGINRTLKSFQLEGLNWMRKQELTKWRGGLLGDEMGMGKTIQAVSLIMSDYPQKDPTLVAVPPVALMQWTNEINEYTNGKLKVLVYHGQNAAAKKMTVKQLKEYDVIMISYAGLESIHRKETKGWTRGDNVVKANSPIHAIKFHRLILDEAHSIKSRTTGVAKACFALKGTYKWCLSGTPVQNRIGEFFSLLRFLEVEPFANYFCKQCRCSCLSWSVGPDYRCTACGHRSLDHVSVFNQEILNPIIATDSDAHRKLAFKKLRMLTDRIMLRRMKRDYTSSMELPPKEVIIHREFFGPIESDFAGSIMNSTTRKFDTYVSRGVMLNNYANIFGLIMQMRQVADHPDLILRKNAAEGQNVLVCNICDEAAEDAIKSRCKHEFCRSCVKDFIKSFEGNDAAPGCPRCHIPLSIDLEQPEIEQDEEMVKKNSIINRIKMENWTSSTKIEMLVYDLWQLRSKKQTTKSIVFSQFTSMLQLVEWRLRRAGFNTVLLDGSMTPQQRQKSIEHFMTDPDVEVFLVSLKAGGVALNLTEASRVFIIDPWWNPAAEWQSADRCHRIGQRRPCVITRLVVEDSIESRIVMLQEKKAQMIQGTVNNDDVAMEKLTPQDMQFLFRGS